MTLDPDQLARAVLRASGDPIWVYGPDLRFLYASPAAAQMSQREPGELVGRGWRQLGMPAQIMEPFEDLVRGVMADRAPVKGQAPDAEGRVWEYILTPLLVEEDEVAAVVATARDVTEHERALAQERAARERMAFVARAGETLASSLDHRATLQRLAALAVPRLADWCAVHVVNARGELEEVAVDHADAHRLELARELQRRFPDDGAQGVRYVIASGEPQLVPHVTDEMLAARGRTPEHRALLLELGFRSYIGVPLVARGRVLGALTLITAESGRTYGADDLEVALEVARRAAIAVDNARLFSERSEVARTLQRSLLPTSLPDIPGYEVASQYRPVGSGVEVGGDFYDVFPTLDGRWGAIVGDVCGKGSSAAALTGLARHTVRATATQRPEPVDVLRALNEAVHRETAGKTFFTAAYAVLDPEPGSVRVARGGHPAPLVVRADGLVEALSAPGPLLGPFDDVDFTAAETPLEPGDAIVLYTDGVTEAGGPGRLYGEERLRSTLATLAGQPADDVAAGLHRSVVDFTAGAARDDEAILVVRRRD